MYGFRYLKATYYISIDICLPDNRWSSYKSNILLNARYTALQENYKFSLEQKKNILLNGEKPSQPIDDIMMRLGCALYPVLLTVSPQGKIKRVENFDKIKIRRTAESNKILNEMLSVPVQKYIALSERQMENEKTFLQALLRDTFVRLYFLDETEDELLFPVYNLNGTGTVLYAQCRKNSIDEHTVNYDWEDDDSGAYCRLVYKYSSLKDIISIKASISAGNIGGKEYKKEINICLNKEGYEIKKSNEFVSFFID